MSNGTHRRHGALLAGAALFAAGVVACALIEPRIAAAGWLIGFVFWSKIAVGSLLLMMIHRLTGGRWGFALLPVIEPLAATIPLLFVLVIPIFIAIRLLYPWAGGLEVVKPDVLTAYLNVPWFIGRSLIALAGWSALALLLPRLAGPRGLLLAAVGLAFHCLVIGPIGFDWILSIEPPFASSSFGASLAITQLIAALAFALVLLHAADGDPAIADLGGLLLAFTLGITYVDFMAVLVLWYGDVPRTVAWFVVREPLPWSALAVASFLLVSLIPFGALILARVRQRRSALRVVAVGILIGLFCYDAYLLAPPFGAAALLPALLATIAIGLLIAALLAWPRRLPLVGRRPAYGE
jgi:hypothetical protein